MVRKIILLVLSSFMALGLFGQNIDYFNKKMLNPEKGIFPPVICPIGDGQSHHYVPPVVKPKNSKSNQNGLQIIVDYGDDVFLRGVQPIFDDFIAPLLAETFTSNIPVRIQVEWEEDVGFLAATGNPYRRAIPSLPRQNTFYPIALAEKILNRHINDPESPDMTVTINGDIDWYYAWFRPENVGNRFDLASTLYHEIYHGLGFATLSSLEDDLGTLGFTLNSEPDGPFSPHVYSHFLETGSGEPLLSVEDDTLLAELFTGGDLFISTPTIPDSGRAEIYAPGVYSGGSSLSHFDESTFNNTESALMTPSSGRGEIERAAGSADSVLYDLGWRYTSIVHEHPDTIEGVNEDFVVEATIVSDYPVDESTLTLYYFPEGGGDAVAQPMVKDASGLFTASIPANGSEQDINYYMTLEALDGTLYTNPGEAPSQALWTHSFGFDNEAPVITHLSPAERISEADRFIDLVVESVEDDFTGPATPQVEWRLNGESMSTEDMRFELIDEFSFEPSWLYTIEIPVDMEISENDILEYRILASDKSIAKNSTTSPEQGYYRIMIEPVPDPLVQFFADFSEENLGFLSDGLFVQSPAELDGDMVGSEHPYPAAGAGNTVDFIYQLEAPLIINGDDPTIKFDEIVIVEKGEPGTKFGDFEFWDYVIVEGLKKGDRNWFRFLDGYDSSDDPDWSSTYDAGGVASSDLWRPREIDMLENGFFKDGDEIFIRFRMFSDPAAVSWGWVFDNLRIQEQVVAVEDFVESKNDFNVFPNPVGNTLHLSLNLKQSAENSVISISDIHGRTITSETVNLEKNNRTHTIDVSQLPKGVYLVSVRFNKNDIITRKVVK